VGYHCQSVALVVQKSLNQYLLKLREEKEKLRYSLKWGTVGGEIKKIEKPEVSAIRELKEETGIKINKCEFISRKYDIYKNSRPLIVHFFYCRIPSKKIVRCFEGQKFQYFSKKQILYLKIPKIVREVILGLL